MKMFVSLLLVLTIACTLDYTDAFNTGLYRLLFARPRRTSPFQPSRVNRNPRQQRQYSLLPNSSIQRRQQVILLNPQNTLSSLLNRPTRMRISQRRSPQVAGSTLHGQSRLQNLLIRLPQIAGSTLQGQGRHQNLQIRLPQTAGSTLQGQGGLQHLIIHLPQIAGNVRRTQPQPAPVLPQTAGTLFSGQQTQPAPVLPQTAGTLFSGQQTQPALSQFGGGYMQGQPSLQELMFLLGGEQRNRRLLAGTVVKNDPRLPGVQGVVAKADGTDGTIIGADGSVISVDGSDVRVEPPSFF